MHKTKAGSDSNHSHCDCGERATNDFGTPHVINGLIMDWWLNVIELRFSDVLTSVVMCATIIQAYWLMLALLGADVKPELACCVNVCRCGWDITALLACRYLSNTCGCGYLCCRGMTSICAGDGVKLWAKPTRERGQTSTIQHAFPTKLNPSVDIVYKESVPHWSWYQFDTFS